MPGRRRALLVTIAVHLILLAGQGAAAVVTGSVTIGMEGRPS